MASGENFDVILRLILENEAFKREVSESAGAFDKLERAVKESNDYLNDQKKILEDLKRSLRDLKERQKDFAKGGREYNTLGEEIKKVTVKINEHTDAVKREEQTYKDLRGQLQAVEAAKKNQIELMQREAAALNRMAALRAKELADLKERAAWIERGARPLFTAGVAGFTAIALIAKKYIDSTEESNELTERWAKSSERVSEAQMRIGKVAAEAVLPLFEKLADISEKAAAFVEKHPGVIEGGLKASIVAAGLGGIGLLVSKGITLYADIKMIAVGDMQLLAAKIMSDAANKQLAAATGGRATGAAGTAATVSRAAPAGAAAAGGISAGATAVALVLGVIAAKLATMFADELLKATGVSAKIAQAQQKIAEEAVRPYPAMIPQVHNASAAVVSFTAFLQKMGINIQENSAVVSKNTDEQTKATQSTVAAAQANNRISQALFFTQRSAEIASQSLARVPSALSSVASSVVNFIQRIISGITGSSGSKGKSVGSHDFTGYAYSRVYAMAQDGKRQFVMSGDMTRVAEQMLGGQLNQQAVLSALAGGSSRTQVVWNDSRKFSGEYTASMRRANRRDTIDILSEVLK